MGDAHGISKLLEVAFCDLKPEPSTSRFYARPRALKKEKRASTDIGRAPDPNGEPDYRPKYLAFRSVKLFHFSGRSSSAKIADTGQTGTQAPQSMHSTGSMYNISSSAYAGESFFGWMQSTGQASTHAVSSVARHGSAITYAIKSVSP